ncbi:MAG: Diguanylate cyclase protein [Frankiales bacterium]|jgi:diguanylate cyclase (GGDEF)-like protein|nr:Diguanylate cyclase protein [Frankiales bacterium]
MVSSWLTLVAVLVIGVTALVATAVVMETRLQRSGLTDIQARGRVLGAVLVEGEFDARDLRTGITPVAAKRMRARLDRFLAHDELLGLQVWAHGDLLFAYPELASTAAQGGAVEVANGTTARVITGRRSAGVATDHVLTTLDLTNDRTPDAIIVTIFPASATHALTATYQQRLAVGGGLLLAIVLGMLVQARRRVLRQEHQTLHDPLTGLRNRQHLINAARECAQRDYSLLLLDLDGFKEVNDTLGHAAGDELLVQVATALSRAVRPHDYVARLGGDEFAVLLVGVESTEEAIPIALKLKLDLTQRGFVVRDIVINVDASVGVAVRSGASGHIEFEELLRQADVAMYRAKSTGAGVVLYDLVEDHHDTDKLGMLSELRQGIARDELVLQYQPLVTSWRPAPGGPVAQPPRRVRSVEALVRWQHPTRGRLGPNVFMPGAEYTGLIHDLTAWVLNAAVAQAAAWQRSGLDLVVAVNLSPRAITDDTVRQVLTALDVHGLPSNRLKLEITETAVADDPVRTILILRALRTAGVLISLDDFGAGNTSLAHLTSLPLNELKIDKSLIDEVTVSADKSAVVLSVVELAHRLGLTVVAEGVETAAICDHVTALGCDAVQGYFHSRPVDPQQLDAWLAEPSFPASRAGD